MFVAIPNYPDYQFDTETLCVRSLERKTGSRWGKHRTVKEKILIPILTDDGYYLFNLSNGNGQKSFRRYQLTWLIKYGSLPNPKEFEIDHKDGIKSNDHFSNLQLLTHRENVSKAWEQIGVKYPTGVSKQSQCERYMAKIKINGKQVYLGLFKTIKEASIAYQNALLNLERPK